MVVLRITTAIWSKQEPSCGRSVNTTDIPGIGSGSSRSHPSLEKACDYLHQWREHSKKDSLRGKGYGMIDGKVADPEDHFHQFMLNGYGYLGVKRMAEVFAAIGCEEMARNLQAEAEDWKKGHSGIDRQHDGEIPRGASGRRHMVPDTPALDRGSGPTPALSETRSHFAHTEPLRFPTGCWGRCIWSFAKLWIRTNPWPKPC